MVERPHERSISAQALRGAAQKKRKTTAEQQLSDSALSNSLGISASTKLYAAFASEQFASEQFSIAHTMPGSLRRPGIGPIWAPIVAAAGAAAWRPALPQLFSPPLPVAPIVAAVAAVVCGVSCNSWRLPSLLLCGISRCVAAAAVAAVAAALLLLLRHLSLLCCRCFADVATVAASHAALLPLLCCCCCSCFAAVVAAYLAALLLLLLQLLRHISLLCCRCVAAAVAATVAATATATAIANAAA